MRFKLSFSTIFYTFQVKIVRMIDSGLFMMIYKPSKLIYSSVHIDRVYHLIRDHFTRIPLYTQVISDGPTFFLDQNLAYFSLGRKRGLLPFSLCLLDVKIFLLLIPPLRPVLQSRSSSPRHFHSDITPFSGPGHLWSKTYCPKNICLFFSCFFQFLARYTCLGTM